MNVRGDTSKGSVGNQPSEGQTAEDQSQLQQRSGPNQQVRQAFPRDLRELLLKLPVGAQERFDERARVRAGLPGDI